MSHFKQSNTFPLSLEDFQQNLFYLRSGFVSAAFDMCYRYMQLCSSASIHSCISAAIPHSAVQFHTDPMVQWLCVLMTMLSAKQHPAHVSGELSKHSILSPSVVGACLAHNRLSLCITNCTGTNVCPRPTNRQATWVASMPMRCFWTLLCSSILEFEYTVVPKISTYIYRILN